MRWITLITLVCFLFAVLPSCALLQPGISEEERQHYLDLAEEYDRKASQAQKEADAYWQMYAEVDPWVRLRGLSEQYKELGERYDELAKQHREQANHYRMLAHGCQEKKE